MSMTDYLVVANQTLAGPHLLEELRRRVSEGPSRFHVVVPANVYPGWTHTETEAHQIARKNLDQALDRFAELDAEVDGMVGNERPLDAIGDALRHWSCDEIILSTLPAGISRWLGMDLVSRTARTYDVPVTHVEAAEASSA